MLKTSQFIPRYWRRLIVHLKSQVMSVKVFLSVVATNYNVRLGANKKGGAYYNPCILGLILNGSPRGETLL